MQKNDRKVLIIGAGLAGSEASWYLAENDIPVVLVECKTIKKNPAQKVDTYAELVCTNSLKSNAEDSAHGILKGEMRKLGSLSMKVAEMTKVPAGNALAVNRDEFSQKITEMLSNHDNIQIVHEEATDPQELADKYECTEIVIATGPLTTKPLEDWIKKSVVNVKSNFYFYDAIAPVVDADSLDYSKLYFKDRHVDFEEGTRADYLNAPMNKEEYETFISELKSAEKTPARNFEDYKFFESCLPIDVMAERGIDTARFSCLKPVGLEMENGKRPYACVQLRRENLLGSAFNLVGFQTRLKFGEQKRVFKMIPGFENAEFIHMGSVHRNSYIDSKELLEWDFSSKHLPHIYFAGQISGVEGYTESAAMGQYVAYHIVRKRKSQQFVKWPVETAIGALVNYVMTAPKPIPSNINFGLIPSVTLNKEERQNRKLRKKIKHKKASARAQSVFSNFYEDVIC